MHLLIRNYDFSFMFHAIQIDLATNAGELELFSNADHPQFELIKVCSYLYGFIVNLDLVTFAY
jgi:hypothetical protein